MGGFTVKRVSVVAMAAVGVFIGCFAAAGGAAASQVVVKYFPGGATVPQGHATNVGGAIRLPTVGYAECYGSDLGGSLGANPSSPLTVNGTGHDVKTQCYAEGRAKVTSGSFALTQLAIATTGVVTVNMRMIVYASNVGCTYEVVKVKGKQPFGANSAIYVFVKGAAKLEKGVAQAPGCAKKVKAEGQIQAEDLSGEAYVVELGA